MHAIANTAASLEPLLQDRRLWRGQDAPQARRSTHPTGCAALDAALPGGGWPEAALVEVMIAADGVGELALLLQTLAALSRADRPVLVVAPPYRVYAPAWQAAGLRLSRLHLVEAAPKDALWVMEQALRAGCCGAVLGWPLQADDHALRRLQVAAEAGQTLGIAFRSLRARDNPSPAPLRLSLRGGGDGGRPELRLLKCRGALPPAGALPFHPAALAHPAPAARVHPCTSFRH
ncbi:translesion DNA synthesis-associated protein ImuA [soil metagenome]